jgi:hypothetical protein
MVSFQAAAAPLAAQTVRGRVTDASTGVPIVGAVVLLLDSAGARLGGILSGPDGLFRLIAPANGVYRLRAEMIGRRSIESPALEVAGEAPFQTLALPIQPIHLAGLDINPARRCARSTERARETHMVWEEAQKALTAESITREAALYRFVVASTSRRLDALSDSVISEVKRYATHTREEPFETLEPELLDRDGYARVEQGQFWIYGPTTRVLLSPSFQTTHCFALKREKAKPGQIGLTFKPVPDRRQMDIEGVLWLDEETAQLNTMEYRYVNIQRQLLRGEYTGYAAFERLPAGAWILRRWWLRSPAQVRRGRLTVVHEQAGEVLSIEPIR